MKGTSMDAVGFRLKRLREKKGCTLEDAAKKLGVTKSCICYWERGEHQPSMIWLLCLSDFYGASIDYIVRGREFNEKD